ncbi:MAG: hypothetical protein GX771_06295 [Halomonadaceae bacterium]|nr:hypothetical protein [Halomonadaceae bacterium]
MELAAKAAGYNAFPGHAAQMMDSGWNPLTDDGDALRLAVKLDIGTDSNLSRVWAFSCTRDICEEEEKGSDPVSATRRAIVRAAAEIGRAMP